MCRMKREEFTIVEDSRCKEQGRHYLRDLQRLVPPPACLVKLVEHVVMPAALLEPFRIFE